MSELWQRLMAMPAWGKGAVVAGLVVALTAATLTWRALDGDDPTASPSPGLTEVDLLPTEGGSPTPSAGETGSVGHSPSASPSPTTAVEPTAPPTVDPTSPPSPSPSPGPVPPTGAWTCVDTGGGSWVCDGPTHLSADGQWSCSKPFNPESWACSMRGPDGTVTWICTDLGDEVDTWACGLNADNGWVCSAPAGEATTSCTGSEGIMAGLEWACSHATDSMECSGDTGAGEGEWSCRHPGGQQNTWDCSGSTFYPWINLPIPLLLGA